MNRIAIIGAGISGLSMAQLLKDRYEISVFEKETRPGGLIRCKRINGSLFHCCGGHVFNTKNVEVSKWFWSKFNRERDFVRADRNSAVCLRDGLFVPYPIENHVYLLGREIQCGFVNDLKTMIKDGTGVPKNFDDFLRIRFGRTLYELYFKPYNSKIWRKNLSAVPLEWLAGKLPMPTVDEMILANMNHLEERSFVHSSFWYAKENGSQFIADVMSEGVDVHYGVSIDRIARETSGQYSVDGALFDRVVYCGNVKDLPHVFEGIDLKGFHKEIRELEFHGTTAAFCEVDANPYSWFYQPSPLHDSHRVICTGNFSPSNNAPGKMTCTVEFTDEIGADEINDQLRLMPYHLRYLTHTFSKYTYPIQHNDTRVMIEELKKTLRSVGIHLVGRFAEWEYFNMDAAIASAMRESEVIHSMGCV